MADERITKRYRNLEVFSVDELAMSRDGWRVVELRGRGIGGAPEPYLTPGQQAIAESSGPAQLARSGIGIRAITELLSDLARGRLGTIRAVFERRSAEDSSDSPSPASSGEGAGG